MISQNFVYWFTRLDHLHDFIDGLQFLCGLFVIGLGIAAIVSFIAKHMAIADREEDLEQAMSGINNKVCPLFMLVFFISVLLPTLQTFIPTTKEMAAIYVIPKIANNESVQEIGSEMMDLAKEWLKELRPENTIKVINKAAVQTGIVVSNAVSTAASEISNTVRESISK